jgi:hypothetical protein
LRSFAAKVRATVENDRERLLAIGFALAAHPACFAAALDSLMSGEVRVAMQLREIDPGALRALENQFRNDHRLADRDAPFQEGDVVTQHGLPWRRLILAAASGDTWFIHYEHGGIGLHSHLVALARSGNSWRVVFSGTDFYPYDTLPKLRDAIRSGKFREEAIEL